MYRIYARVSTEEQNLKRQLKKTSERAEREGAEPEDIEMYRDKSTGTNTDRKGFQNLLKDTTEGDVIIVSSVSRIARSIRDLDITIEQLKQDGAEIQIIDEGLEMKPDEEDPYQNALLQLLGVFSELEAELTKSRVKEGIQARQNSSDEYHHGRSPLGHTSDNGKLYPADNYDRVCEVLKLVTGGDISKRQAAKELDTSRTTISRAIDERADLYGL
jgi:DNA invertase Pin-like site-specific DNA recombinase